ncbi:MAG TPA: TetR/AcrR family transcriptional regulator [Chloroflexota bacterium]|nr:TetR/AcrR family transcriptional regulator [Chloroflexota bacterium]
MTSEDEPIVIGEMLMNEDDGRAERRDAAANRYKILQTAERLFAVHGVGNVNMADIAQAAGVGKGTLYRRFANKGELCLALLDTQMADFQNGMLARMQQMNIAGLPKLEQLMQFIDALVYFTDTHSPLLCEVQREGLLPLDNARLQLPHFWQYMTVSALLRTAAATGEISPDLDIDYLADALLSPLKADFFQFQKTNRGFTLERISAGLRTLISGLRYASPDP